MTQLGFEEHYNKSVDERKEREGKGGREGGREGREREGGREEGGKLKVTDLKKTFDIICHTPYSLLSIVVVMAIKVSLVMPLTLNLLGIVRECE